MEIIETPQPTPTYRSPRPTKATHSQRVYTVFNMLLAGYNRGFIVEYCRNNWNLKRAAADNLIKKAKDDIIKESDKQKEYAYGLAIYRFEQLYKNSFKINDFKTCADIVMKEAKLQGLLEHPSQVNVNMNTSDADDIRRRIDAAIRADPENRQRIVAELEKDE